MGADANYAVNIAKLETQMSHIKEAIDEQKAEMTKLAECYQTNTVLLEKTCTVLQEFKSVKDYQQEQALANVAQEKDILLLKRWCKALSVAVVLALGTGVDAEQLKAITKLIGI